MRLDLIAHPSCPPTPPHGVSAEIRRSVSGIWIEFTVTGADAVRFPARVPPERTDGLWQTTCFELFACNAAGEYIEFNFSPSTQWAAYSFTGYRAGMADLPCDDPGIVVAREGDLFSLTVAALALPDGFDRIGLSAVIEETDGTKSYWALAHPPEGPPDFHHPACFALELPAPDGA